MTLSYLEPDLAIEAIEDRQRKGVNDRGIGGLLARFGHELVEEKHQDGTQEILGLKRLDKVRKEPEKEKKGGR